MDITIRQTSELIDGGVVSEYEYSAPAPDDILGALRLILDNLSDAISSMRGFPSSRVI